MAGARVVALVSAVCITSGTVGFLVGSDSRAPAGQEDPARAESERVREGLVRERDALRREVATLRTRPAEAAKPPVTAASPAPPKGDPAPPPAPARNLQAEAYSLMRPLVADATQIRDAGKRASALATVREWLAGGDPARVLAGLMAVNSLGQVDYEKGSMRPLVLPLLESPEPALRRAAMWALLSTDTQAGDVDLLLRMENDTSPEVRAQIPGLLARAAKGDLTGEVSRVILKSMEGASPRELRNLLPGYWRKLSPEMEERLLALARAPETRNDTIYYCLSAASEKTPGIVDVLVEAVGCDDPECSRRALWGLSWGVPAALAPRVAPVLLRNIEEKGTGTDWQTSIRALQNLATPDELPGLVRLSENPLAPEALRKAAAEAAEAVRRRLPR